MSVKGIWDEKLPILQFPQKVALKKLMKKLCFWLDPYSTLKVNEEVEKKEEEKEEEEEVEEEEEEVKEE